MYPTDTRQKCVKKEGEDNRIIVFFYIFKPIKQFAFVANMLTRFDAVGGSFETINRDYDYLRFENGARFGPNTRRPIDNERCDFLPTSSALSNGLSSRRNLNGRTMVPRKVDEGGSRISRLIQHPRRTLFNRRTCGSATNSLRRIL